MLPLSWFWPHGGELSGAQPKQKFLEVRQRGTLQGPAQGNRSTTFAPLKKIKPWTTISRGQCVARLFGRHPRRGSLREDAYKTKFAVDEYAEASIEHDPEV